MSWKNKKVLGKYLGASHHTILWLFKGHTDPQTHNTSSLTNRNHNSHSHLQNKDSALLPWHRRHTDTSTYKSDRHIRKRDMQVMPSLLEACSVCFVPSVSASTDEGKKKSVMPSSFVDCTNSFLSKASMNALSPPHFVIASARIKPFNFFVLVFSLVCCNISCEWWPCVCLKGFPHQRVPPMPTHTFVPLTFSLNLKFLFVLATPLTRR